MKRKKKQRLIKVGRRSRITAGGGKSMRLQPFPWRGITNLCPLKDGEDIFVDGSAYGEVCSKIGIILLFQQLEAAFAGVESSGDEMRSLFG